MSPLISPETTVNLLIVDRSLNDTEMFKNALRNSGIAAHAWRVDEAEEMQEALTQNPVDLVVFNYEPEGMDLKTGLSIYEQAGKQIPLIVTHREDDDGLLLSAMHHGAKDIVNKEDTERLQLVLARELKHLLVARRLQACEQKLRETEARCTALIDSSRDAIAYVHEGMHIYANPVYLSTFGFVDMEEIEGVPLMDTVAPSHHQKFKEFIRKFDKSGDSTAKLEVTCVDSDTKNFEASMEFSAASIEGEPCTQIIIRDQSQKKELEEKLRELTTQDIQTGLFNRQYLVDHIDAIMGREEPLKRGTALLFVNLDHFQEIRESAGLATGDAVLKEIADLIKAVADGEDIVARFGDHSFAVLAARSTTDSVDKLAKAIADKVSNHMFESSSKFVSPTCSIGIALWDAELTDSQSFVNQAFQAAEAAGAEGGNRVRMYTPAEFSTVAAEEGSETNVSELIGYALKNERFRLFYQPIVSLQGDTRENYAVLLRLLDKNDELILPNMFLPQAELDNSMLDIDRWVIQNAIKELSTQRREGRKVNFFISLSGSSLEDDSLLIWIFDCLRDEEVKGSWLAFQVSDKSAREHLQAFKRLAEGLKKINARVAIDRFGLAPKNEGLLKHLDVDYVKFDQSFLGNLTTNQDKQDQLKELHVTAESYKTRTIAVGVEDANTLAILWTIGINYVQGYFLQEPSTAIAYDFGSG